MGPGSRIFSWPLAAPRTVMCRLLQPSLLPDAFLGPWTHQHQNRSCPEMKGSVLRPMLPSPLCWSVQRSRAAAPSQQRRAFAQKQPHPNEPVSLEEAGPSSAFGVCLTGLGWGFHPWDSGLVGPVAPIWGSPVVCYAFYALDSGGTVSRDMASVLREQK